MTSQNNPNAIDIDIVLPCYNPQANWSQNIVDKIRSLQKILEGITIRVIVVNDGSKEGVSDQDIKQLREGLSHFLYLPQESNHGKGYVLRKGIVEAAAPICIYTDIDFPYSEESFLAIYEALQSQSTDIAVGIKNQDYYKNVPRNRVRISRFLRWLIRTVLRISITDTQCGLKGFNQKGRDLFLQTKIKRYLFDLEFIYLADHTKDIKMTAIPIQLREGVVFSKVNWHILWQEGWNFVKIVLLKK